MREIIKHPSECTEASGARWWGFSQNNSGGYHIENDEVGAYVFIQAISVKEALRKANEVFEDHSSYCDCCGERWSTWVDESDGTILPEIYGEPVDDYRSYSWSGKTAILYHIDGTVERTTFKEKK